MLRWLILNGHFFQESLHSNLSTLHNHCFEKLDRFKHLCLGDRDGKLRKHLLMKQARRSSDKRCRKIFFNIKRSSFLEQWSFKVWFWVGPRLDRLRLWRTHLPRLRNCNRNLSERFSFLFVEVWNQFNKTFKPLNK